MAAEKTAQSRVGQGNRVGPRTNFGLTWINRVNGRTPYWRAPSWYLPHGSDKPPENVNLSPLADKPDELLKRCQGYESEALAWRAGVRGHVGSFDGTFGQIIQKYLHDEESTFRALRPSSRHPYEFYANRLHYELGDKRIDEVTGLDLKRWHERWSESGEKLAASKMMRAVLDAAISFSIMSAKPGSPELRAASELREVLKTASRKIPNPRRRESVITADQVVALRAAAHADNRPSCALVYAMVFETTLRLWDVIGQWWPMDAPLISDVVMAPHTSMKESKKWFGIRWEDIDASLVLRYVPSKTSAKTGLAVTYPLTRAPMVMEELAHWPDDKRRGPLIVADGTGLPYSSNYFGEQWRKDRKAAGISDKIWARDLRASGITEGRASGVSTDDAAKVAGHASTKTTAAVYDRATLEAAERFADARAAKRGKK
ncbi:integrase [Mesorhizobium sp. BR1-1-12]|uniref:integrase n=1 Tax=Mesorhizobium sp. BR1-1-12 TaxID=2876657 RepID=UPI001CD08A28|nr:integrase [Mesorhizobium sp. BR1-1-12]MBZ9973456.1 integrase [Mesorhizobium sp. BR1-1-12]